jgi:NAD(P)-dependent dehydrogenase (short-subunit alcohol dehydrogenase family)
VCEIRAAGGIADACPTDLRDEQQVTALIDEAAAARPPDLLVNNAGTGVVRWSRTAAWTNGADPETNVIGTLVACRARCGTCCRGAPATSST